MIWLQRTNLFHPNRDDSGYRPKNFTEFFIDKEGKDVGYPLTGTISGWYIDNGSKKTILFCHGNAGNITHRDYIIELTKSLGFNLVLFDYSGFGNSSGQPTLSGILNEGEVVYTYITKFIRPDDLIVWGESIGSAVAIHIASNYKCSRLVLMGAFSSLDDVLMYYDSLKYRIIGSIAGFFVNTMRNKDTISKIQVPVAIIHSITDEVIPYHCALELYRSIQHFNKILITITGSHSSPNISKQCIDSLSCFLNIEQVDEEKVNKIIYLVNTAAERYKLK